jgi:hypothetical protein
VSAADPSAAPSAVASAEVSAAAPSAEVSAAAPSAEVSAAAPSAEVSAAAPSAEVSAAAPSAEVSAAAPSAEVGAADPSAADPSAAPSAEVSAEVSADPSAEGSAEKLLLPEELATLTALVGEDILPAIYDKERGFRNTPFARSVLKRWQHDISEDIMPHVLRLLSKNEDTKKLFEEAIQSGDIVTDAAGTKFVMQSYDEAAPAPPSPPYPAQESGVLRSCRITIAAPSAAPSAADPSAAPSADPSADVEMPEFDEPPPVEHVEATTPIDLLAATGNPSIEQPSVEDDIDNNDMEYDIMWEYCNKDAINEVGKLRATTRIFLKDSDQSLRQQLYEYSLRADRSGKVPYASHEQKLGFKLDMKLRRDSGVIQAGHVAKLTDMFQKLVDKGLSARAATTSAFAIGNKDFRHIVRADLPLTAAWPLKGYRIL